MSATLAAADGASIMRYLRRGAPLAALLIGTAALGLAGQGAARPVFVLGCALVAWDLLRFGPAAHLSGSLVLFCLAPLLRRVVDLVVGYDPSGVMISGPLIGLIVVAAAVLSRLACGRRLHPAQWPLVVAALCLLYAIALTLLGGEPGQAVAGALKWGAPLLYGFWLFDAAPTQPGLLRSLTSTALVLAPAMGLYGVLQYLDPPAWDRFWMSYTTIASIGTPEPFMVRVFSTLNAPAGYAAITVAALLLFGLGRMRLTLLLAAAPAVLGLMLSMYRTAWIALAAGLLAALFHRRTVRRAAPLLVAVSLLAAAVVLFTPAGDALSARLGTFGDVGGDVSGQERLAQYAVLLDGGWGTLFGHGFGGTDVMQAGAQAFDGQFVVAWYLMGLVVGLVSVAALLWAVAAAIRGAWRNDSAEGVAVVGILIGFVVQMPLAVVSSSEIGFVFWAFVAIGATLPVRPGRANR